MMAAPRASAWILGGVLAATAVSQGAAHHGGGTPPPVADHVAHLVEMADEACFVRGSDAGALAEWATLQHWTPATPDQLAAGSNSFATLVAGWTYETPFAAFAVVQSRLNAPNDGYICSLTTKLTSAGEHSEIRAAFQKRFDTVLPAEPEHGENHTDQFWIERDPGPPVKATILHTPATQSITIRMIHGKARPLRS